MTFFVCVLKKNCFDRFCLFTEFSSFYLFCLLFSFCQMTRIYTFDILLSFLFSNVNHRPPENHDSFNKYGSHCVLISNALIKINCFVNNIFILKFFVSFSCQLYFRFLPIIELAVFYAFHHMSTAYILSFF